jgi:hypothetical protein
MLDSGCIHEGELSRIKKGQVFLENFFTLKIGKCSLAHSIAFAYGRTLKGSLVKEIY